MPKKKDHKDIDEERRHQKTNNGTKSKQKLIRQRTPSQQLQTKFEAICRQTQNEQKLNNITKSKKRSTEIPGDDIQIVREVSSRPSPEKSKKWTAEKIKLPAYKCNECIKWELRLHQQLKNRDMEKAETTRIIKSLTEENMKIRAERESWKTLYMSKR